MKSKEYRTMKESKKREILENLYIYCAMNGFNNIDNISQLSKALEISRPLFYFYFNSGEQLFQELMQFHYEQLDQALLDIQEKQMTFHEYIYNLVNLQNLYFYALRCSNRRSENEAYFSASKYGLDTIDNYSYQQFIIHYQLEHLPKKNLKSLYHSFREFWFSNSGSYHDWNKTKIDKLLSKVEDMLTLLPSKTAEE